jgi:Na+-driven multidrug efflux pump
MVIDATRLWVFRFLTLFICEVVFKMGVRSIWYCVVVSNGISAAILFVLYKLDIWRKPVVNKKGRK